MTKNTAKRFPGYLTAICACVALLAGLLCSLGFTLKQYAPWL